MEKELIDQLQKGKRQAQHDLYKTYSKKMFLLILRYINDEDEAGSLTNQVFYKIIQNINRFTYSENNSFEAWMKKIAVNESLMYIRKKRKIHYTEKENDLDSEKGQLSDSNLVAEDYFNLIRELPDGYRLIFNLYAIEGYSHQEIAVELKINESTSRSQLSHARALLRKKIEKYF